MDKKKDDTNLQDVLLTVQNKPYTPRTNLSNEWDSLHPNGNGINSEDVDITITTNENAAVLVYKAKKNYGSLSVLQSLDMVVQQHQIYFLLGSSGCGKTTILSNIVALQKLDSGKIFILGKQTGTRESGVPGKTVGYMPQELALNAECTISESLHFFGRLYGMSPNQIEIRRKYLLQLLNLELCTQNMSKLSGGQQRRASLAVALLHEPEILILDEPTVAMDPLLRNIVWQHLLELVAEKRTSIICTTHYIEETQQGGRIGIMRSGRLLAEGHPMSLMRKYNSDNMSNMVLKLCVQDEIIITTNANREDINTTSGMDEDHNQFIRQFQNRRKSSAILDRNLVNAKPARIKTTSSRNRLHALTVKNGLVMARNWWLIIFLAVIPALTVAIFCSCVGSHPTNLGVGIINNEVPGEICKGEKACSATRLSCRFLDAFDRNMIELVPFENEADALNQVHLTNIWGYMTFHENYSDYTYQRVFEDPLGNSWNETYYGSLVKIKLDMSSPSIGMAIKKLIFDAYRKFTLQLLTTCQLDPTGKDIPLLFEDPIFGVDDEPFAHYMAPGVALGFVFFIGALTCGLYYIAEKKDGMLSRTVVAGVSRLEIMLSHFIFQFFVMLSQVSIIFGVLFILFDIPCYGSMPLAFLLVTINSVSGMSLGFLVASICNEEKNAMLVAMGTIFPSFLISGLIWPVSSLPKLLQDFSIVLPATMSGEAMRSIISRGLPFTHPVVYSGFLASSAWTFFYLFLTVLLNWIISRKR